MIIGIYLAAGKSKRMGYSKLNLTIGDTPLGSLALKTAIESKLDKVIVVTREEDVLEWLPSLFFLAPYIDKWIQVPCKQSEKGQAESIKCGLKVAQEMKAKAVIILLADQPLITKEIIDKIISSYKEKINFVASCYKGVLRPPVLFDSKLFPELFKLQGDEGARRMLRSGANGIIIDFKNRREFLDVDTFKQYEALKKTLNLH